MPFTGSHRVPAIEDGAAWCAFISPRRIYAGSLSRSTPCSKSPSVCATRYPHTHPAEITWSRAGLREWRQRVGGAWLHGRDSSRTWTLRKEAYSTPSANSRLPSRAPVSTSPSVPRPGNRRTKSPRCLAVSAYLSRVREAEPCGVRRGDVHWAETCFLQRAQHGGAQLPADLVEPVQEQRDPSLRRQISRPGDSASAPEQGVLAGESARHPVGRKLLCGVPTERREHHRHGDTGPPPRGA